MRPRTAIWLIGITVSLAARGSSTVAGGLIQDQHAPISTCSGKSLAPPIEQLIGPVLLARASALRRSSDWDTGYEKAFYRLLDLKGPRAHEARVALMAYYTGEHYGEELLETALATPKESDRLVARYRACRPSLSFEAHLTGVGVLSTLYDIYVESRSQPNSGAVER